MKDLNKKIVVTRENVDTIFSKCPVSTQTIVAPINGKTSKLFDLEKLYKYIPLLDEQITKDEIEQELENKDSNILYDGCIVSLQYENNKRGVCWKKYKRKTTRARSYFLNSLMIVMIIRDDTKDNKTGSVWKKINAKVSENGNLHITGCKYKFHYFHFFETFIKTLLDVEKITSEKLINTNVEELTCTYQICMRNIDFRLDTNIDRKKIDSFLNDNPLTSSNGNTFVSRYEGSINTGVHVTLKCDIKPTYKTDVSVYNLKTNEHTYRESEVKLKPTKKISYHTFMIFASGAINLSGKGSEMETVFKELLTYLIDNKDTFKDI